MCLAPLWATCLELWDRDKRVPAPRRSQSVGEAPQTKLNLWIMAAALDGPEAQENIGQEYLFSSSVKGVMGVHTLQSL